MTEKSLKFEKFERAPMLLHRAQIEKSLKEKNLILLTLKTWCMFFVKRLKKQKQNKTKQKKKKTHISICVGLSAAIHHFGHFIWQHHTFCQA